MDKKELIRTVEQMIAAPSCCRELKEAGSKWLAAVGTAEEKAAGAALLAEVKEDVSTIEHAIEFYESELGTKIFGAEKAKALAAHSRQVKAAGGKWCDCPACAAGVKVMENAALLA